MMGLSAVKTYRAVTAGAVAALMSLTGLDGGVSMLRAQELSLPLTDVIVIDRARLFRETRFGRRVRAEFDAASAVLAAENRRIEADLEAEEKNLTELRLTMEPAPFRKLADAFDHKVQRIRAEQAGKAKKLAEDADRAQRRFLVVARPVLDRLLRENGASVLIDSSTALLWSPEVDVTAYAIGRIDKALGDGSEIGKGNATKPEPGKTSDGAKQGD